MVGVGTGSSTSSRRCRAAGRVRVCLANECDSVRRESKTKPQVAHSLDQFTLSSTTPLPPRRIAIVAPRQHEECRGHGQEGPLLPVVSATLSLCSGIPTHRTLLTTTTSQRPRPSICLSEHPNSHRLLVCPRQAPAHGRYPPAPDRPRSRRR